uniref:Uncharacterized protein n=1 Tax=Rhizophora mucronata TaxID=61149 RepID=A0A2P2J434_RHIMU
MNMAVTRLAVTKEALFWSHNFHLMPSYSNYYLHMVSD